MKQTRLIKRIIEALGLDDGAKGKFTPSESKPLVKDINGDLASGAFSYSSVVGMLLYSLSGHTRPDITFAVNCCARYMFCPKHSHELALKRIGRYLKQTPDRGMVMDPSSNVCKIDAYPDADFAGMFGHEDHTDPACAKSRTGFIITVVFDDLFETVNRTGVDDQVVESICNGLFQHNRELYAEDELDEVGNLIYRPPPLHEVWLDEAGRRQGNENCIHQRRQNEDLMRERNRAVKKSITPPVATDVDDVGDVPGVAPISDNGSVDSSLLTA